MIAEFFGGRKAFLGICFLGVCAFLGFQGIANHSDLLGLTSVIGAIGAGTFGLVWGNVKEHQFANGGSKSPDVHS